MARPVRRRGSYAGVAARSVVQGAEKFGPAGWLALAALSSRPHVAGLAFGAARRTPPAGGSRLGGRPFRLKRHQFALPGRLRTRPRPDLRPFLRTPPQ